MINSPQAEDRFVRYCRLLLESPDQRAFLASVPDWVSDLVCQCPLTDDWRIVAIDRECQNIIIAGHETGAQLVILESDWDGPGWQDEFIRARIELKIVNDAAPVEQLEFSNREFPAARAYFGEALARLQAKAVS